MIVPLTMATQDDALRRAVALWRLGGADTLDIAHATGLTEAQVYNAIHADRERRRAAR